MAKVIVLNGFAGAGKTTIGKLYIDDHPLALLIEGDEIIVHLGQWLQYQDEARKIIFEITKSMLSTHLKNGHDVVLPYLITDAYHANEFEKIAKENHAEFYNFYLHNEKDAAIESLFKRGSWGEPGLEPLTEKDRPEAEKLYEDMERQLSQSSNHRTLRISGKTADETYLELTKHLTN